VSCTIAHKKERNYNIPGRRANLPGPGFAPMLIQKTKNMYESKNHSQSLEKESIQDPNPDS
jgi:hypothetical protein